jgi:2-oxoglutarate ferredoxin oxidoreductase subunit gamma
MTKVLDAKIVEEVMLSTVPQKVKEANKKAYELGIKYAQKALLKT